MAALLLAIRHSKTKGLYTAKETNHCCTCTRTGDKGANNTYNVHAYMRIMHYASRFEIARSDKFPVQSSSQVQR